MNFSLFLILGEIKVESGDAKRLKSASFPAETGMYFFQIDNREWASVDQDLVFFGNIDDDGFLCPKPFGSIIDFQGVGAGTDDPFVFK